MRPISVVLIGETWAKTNMTRTHGWAPRGQRLVDKVPRGPSKTNGERFLAYVGQVLLPTLSS
ncbi:transposase [Mesorhizobium sp. M0045]|uniref:hypothetical protein n=1 Tax=Mesorhizobium sp. M0045 TaxID=2956857 RepID=UPI00333B43E7